MNYTQCPPRVPLPCGGGGGANCAVYNINKAWSEASNDLNMQLINTTHPEGTRLPKHENNNALGLGEEEMFDGGCKLWFTTKLLFITLQNGHSESNTKIRKRTKHFTVEIN